MHYFEVIINNIIYPIASYGLWKISDPLRAYIHNKRSKKKGNLWSDLTQEQIKYFADDKNWKKDFGDLERPKELLDIIKKINQSKTESDSIHTLKESKKYVEDIPLSEPELETNNSQPKPIYELKRMHITKKYIESEINNIHPDLKWIIFDKEKISSIKNMNSSIITPVDYYAIIFDIANNICMQKINDIEYIPFCWKVLIFYYEMPSRLLNIKQELEKDARYLSSDIILTKWHDNELNIHSIANINSLKDKDYLGYCITDSLHKDIIYDADISNQAFSYDFFRYFKPKRLLNSYTPIENRVLKLYFRKPIIPEYLLKSNLNEALQYAKNNENLASSNDPIIKKIYSKYCYEYTPKMNTHFKDSFQPSCFRIKAFEINKNLIEKESYDMVLHSKNNNSYTFYIDVQTEHPNFKAKIIDFKKFYECMNYYQTSKDLNMEHLFKSKQIDAKNIQGYVLYNNNSPVFWEEKQYMDLTNCFFKIPINIKFDKISVFYNPYVYKQENKVIKELKTESESNFIDIPNNCLIGDLNNNFLKIKSSILNEYKELQSVLIKSISFYDKDKKELYAKDLNINSKYLKDIDILNEHQTYLSFQIIRKIRMYGKYFTIKYSNLESLSKVQYISLDSICELTLNQVFSKLENKVNLNGRFFAIPANINKINFYSKEKEEYTLLNQQPNHFIIDSILIIPYIVYNNIKDKNIYIKRI